MIMALEGGICSGKTTLARQLEKEGFFVIPEYMDIITPQEQKELEILSIQNKSALSFFLKIEKRRKELYTKQCIQKNVVLDRSYLTLFGYEFAKRNQNFSLDSMMTLSKEEVIIPDLIVFLDVNDQLREKRCINRGDINMPKIFLNSEFNRNLKIFFLEKISEKCLFINSEKLVPEDMINVLRKVKIKQKKQTNQFFQNIFQLER